MAKFNKGDISEGILAAAITARFVSKTKTITDVDVLSIIKKLNAGVAANKGFSSTTSFNSPNSTKNVVDTVICFVNLAEVNMKGFLAMGSYKDKEVKSLVSAAVSYANSIHVREWADEMYTNGQKNKIEVRSEGLLDQSGTKVDLRIIIDGKQCGIGASLKAGDVKQFGQVGGATIESMEELFEPLGVVFTPSDAKKIQSYVANKNPTEALTYAYKIAHKQLTELSKETSEFNKKLAAFMKFHATRNEPYVALVQLAKGQATVYLFEELAKKLTGIPTQVVYSTGNTNVVSGKKIPQLLFYGGKNTSAKNLIIQIRVKLEGNRVNSKGKKLGLVIRNYIEKGALTTELVANH